MANPDFEKAKAQLQTTLNKDGVSVYEHLTKVIGKLISDETVCSPSELEEVSRQVRSQEFEPTSHLKDEEFPSSSIELAKMQSAMIKTEEASDEADEEEQPVTDFMELAQHFENADVGLGQAESFKIFLALKKLASEQPLAEVTFWGKIFGSEQDYYVAEGIFKDGEEPQPEEEEEPDFDNQGEGEEEEDEDAPPKSKYKPPPKLPVEEYGLGCNRKVYFVCHQPGQEWVLLPQAKPDCLVASRQIKKMFTGKLDAPVQTYPPFPGNEGDYLRAQIARITAATHVSPMGFFTFEEEEDEEGGENIMEDEEFEGRSRGELLEPDLSGWVHHSPYILPQGRCNWFNPAEMEDEEEKDEDDEEEEEEEEPEPEVGPPLLTPLQNDDEIDGSPAWTPKLTFPSMPIFSAVCISSHRWPGAHTVCKDRLFSSVYVGWGLKQQPEAFCPPALPLPQPEYEGEDITEALDPTREEEEDFEADQEEKEDEEEEDED